MSTPVTPQKVEGVRVLPIATPLDEAVWKAWVLKGRAQEARGHVAHIKAVKWISLAGLLLAATVGFWSHLAAYDVVVRFVVAAGALVLMLRAFHIRHYAFAIAFGILALLYNPVAPVFSLSGEWQRAIVAASALPFVASLTWRNETLVPNE